MKTMVIIPIRGLKITENLGHGDKILEDLLITNDTTFIENEFKKRGADYKTNGEIMHTLMAESIIYLATEAGATEIQKHQGILMDEAFGFLNALWFWNDNEIIVDRIVGISEQRGGACFFAVPFTYRLFPSLSNMDNPELKRGELRVVRKKYQTLLDAGYSYKTWERNLSDGTPQMTRAVSWLATAREQGSHMVKILLYMTCFETIFPTFTEKIADNLAQRISRFFGSSRRQDEVYNTIRDAYEIRSTIVHGKTLDEKTYQKSIKIVQSLDEYLRLTFNELWKEPKLWERMN